jgi:hypothetical protein
MPSCGLMVKRVEVGDFGVDGAADQLAFGGVQEFTHFCDKFCQIFVHPSIHSV